MLTAPLYMLQLFDRVLSSRSTDTLLFLLLIAVFSLAVLTLLEIVRALVLSGVSSWLERLLSNTVLRETIVSTVQQGRAPNAESLRDLSTVRNALVSPSLFPLLDSPWMPLFLGVMFILHPLLGWLSTAGAVILFGLACLNEYVTRDWTDKSTAALAQVQHQAEAAIRNADVVQAMGMLPNLINRWRLTHDGALVLQSAAHRRGVTITALSKLIRLFLQVGLLSLGALLVLDNELSPGAMIAGSILMSRALAPVEQAIASWKMVVNVRGALTRLKERLGEQSIRRSPMPLPVPQGSVEIENLTYVYPEGEKPALKGVTLALQPGQSLGIMGPTASGKTTLSKLLTGNFKGQTGHVRLDGMDVAEWDADDLGRHIGYLPQTVELFAGTVHENIARTSILSCKPGSWG